MEIRTKAVVFYEDGIRSAREIGETYNVSERTVRRWAEHHRDDPENVRSQRKPGRNVYDIRYLHPWNNELSGSKANILHGEPDGSSTSST